MLISTLVTLFDLLEMFFYSIPAVAGLMASILVVLYAFIGELIWSHSIGTTASDDSAKTQLWP